MLISVFACRNLGGARHGHCLCMLVLCDCFDVADEGGGHVEARGSGVLETLKIVVLGCGVECLPYL